MNYNEERVEKCLSDDDDDDHEMMTMANMIEL